jgi:hypothetical protein
MLPSTELTLERFSIRLNRQRSRFSLILRMILSEKSATFRDHARAPPAPDPQLAGRRSSGVSEQARSFVAHYLRRLVPGASTDAVQIPDISSAFPDSNSLRTGNLTGNSKNPA